MTPKQVRRKYTTIHNKIQKLNEELYALKDICEHPDVTKKFRGSHGNYDPSCDSYWIEWRCPDCNKSWVTDQSRENVLKPGRRVD